MLIHLVGTKQYNGMAEESEDYEPECLGESKGVIGELPW